MKPTLQIGATQIPCEQVFQHLSDSHLLPQLLREMAIEELIDRTAQEFGIDLTPTTAEFDRLTAQVARIGPFQGMNAEQIATISTRTIKLHKFKQAGWGHQVNGYYEIVRDKLHRVVYSILQVEDGSLAQELFFRIQSGEHSFAQLAIQYSQATSAKNGGVVGPVSAKDTPPAIVQTLTKLIPGQLSPLFKLDRYYGFIRLDRWIPTVLDEHTHQVLLDELFDCWIEEHIAIEVGENGEISMSQPNMLTSTLPELAQIETPADRFTPNFAQGEIQISETLDSGILPPTTPEVTVVTEIQPPDLDVSTGFFFPNNQPDGLTQKTLATDGIPIAPTPELILDPQSINPVSQSKARSSQLIFILGLISSLGLLAIGVQYYTQQPHSPAQTLPELPSNR